MDRAGVQAASVEIVVIVAIVRSAVGRGRIVRSAVDREKIARSAAGRAKIARSAADRVRTARSGADRETSRVVRAVRVRAATRRRVGREARRKQGRK